MVVSAQILVLSFLKVSLKMFEGNFLVRAECVHTNVVRALADVVAIIILYFFFLPLTFLPEGVYL